MSGRATGHGGGGWEERAAGTCRRGRRGSVLVVVLVTITFATAALLVFIDRASSDLLVEAREADAQRLQAEAYSALETTLAVLEQFRAVGEGLRSPEEGWGDALSWAGYEAGEGRVVEVTFADESAKLSLPRADFETLARLFESFGTTRPEAERLADALMGWMQDGYSPRTAGAPRAEDYEMAPLPFRPPVRPLRSFGELRAIAEVREAFFDELGRWTPLGLQFREAVSLFDFAQSNVNAASGPVLEALGGFDEFQLRQLEDYRRGRGAYSQGRGFFRSVDEATAILGDPAGAPGLGAQIQALRVIVTVREGVSRYRLEAVVAPAGGAKLVPASALPAATGEAEDPGERPVAPPTEEAADGGNPRQEDEPAAGAIEYPFTLLEIRENAAIPFAPIAPIAPPADPTGSLL